VCGEPRREHRKEFWEFLHFMRAQWSGPCLCCGDFNKVLSQDEHLGPHDRTEAQIDGFWDCLQDCEYGSRLPRSKVYLEQSAGFG
jgi:hypothetical protein